MHETRLGLARHTSTYDRPQNGTFPEPNCSLEGQVANIADRIAYNCHDLEDGMRAMLITFEQLKTIKIFTEAQKRIDAKSIKDRTIRRTRTAKAIINKLVSDCIEETKKILADANIKTPGDVHTRYENLVVLPAKSDAELIELEKFLMQNFYMHKSLIETMDKVKDWLTRLFEKLCQKPDLMPGYFQHFISTHGLHRTVTDYIAGMTDRFALKILNDIQS
jgi:dGTPase